MSPAANTGVRESFIDPKTLMQIRNLELRARVVVQGFWNGLHRSPYHGFSVEFTEYRQYTPGDDQRHIDWRVFARHDRYVIKKYEDETNLRCHLIVDQSRSMNFGTTGWSKAEYARTLLQGRAHVTPEDIQALAAPVLRHRVLVNYRAEAEGISAEGIIDKLMEEVPAP